MGRIIDPLNVWGVPGLLALQDGVGDPIPDPGLAAPAVPRSPEPGLANDAPDAPAASTDPNSTVAGTGGDAGCDVEEAVPASGDVLVVPSAAAAGDSPSAC